MFQMLQEININDIGSHTLNSLRLDLSKHLSQRHLASVMAGG
jgi:hypothetical protein